MRTYLINRIIDDNSLQQRLKVTGKAVYQRLQEHKYPQLYIFMETGEVDGKHQFSQQYFIQQKESYCSVYRDYLASHFFDFRLEEVTNIIHHCGDDIYRGHLIFIDQDIKLEWHVKGPQKDYHMETQYTLLDP